MTTTAKVVTVKDLSTKFGIAAREVRILIRGLGFKAPTVTQDGFGPRAKYEWPTGNADLAKIEAALVAGGKAPKAAKKPETKTDSPEPTATITKTKKTKKAAFTPYYPEPKPESKPILKKKVTPDPNQKPDPKVIDLEKPAATKNLKATA